MKEIKIHNLKFNSKDKKYSLVICEKPNVANRIAIALGTSQVKKVKIKGNIVFDVLTKDNARYVILSSKGHLYGLKDPNKRGKIFPIFDIYWAPISTSHNKNSKNLIELIRRFAKDTDNFIHACDYDQEGELIGYNILELVCEKAYSNSHRAKLPTLTSDDINKSFITLERTNRNMAYAGMFRHLLDYIYGINFSMAVSRAIKIKNRYSYLTVGRVQSPTLKFIVDRDQQINYFIPTPFWRIKAHFRKDDEVFVFFFEKKRINTLKQVNYIIDKCRGKNGIINNINIYKEYVKPLHPFNIGDLQKESFRLFKYSPVYTLSIAENLYLKALISYPRTNSQILPVSINYRKILNDLEKISDPYKRYVTILLNQNKLSPNNGIKYDPAHPAIYPTGTKPVNLNSSEIKVYDLIVRRFFATFGEPAIFKKTKIDIIVDDNFLFNKEGKNILLKGWIEFYSSFYNYTENSVEYSDLQIGDTLTNIDISKDSELTEPPIYFNYSSLLSKMELEEMGTKSTRGNIIELLIRRNYVSVNNNKIKSTDLGIYLIDFMEKNLPKIISTSLTRTLEHYLADIERGITDRIFILNSIITDLIDSMHYIQKIESVCPIEHQPVRRKNLILIGACPVCKKGKFQIIRSKKTKKRFISCTDYFSDGCTASAPLPQQGLIKNTSKICKECNWPILNVFYPTKRYSKNFCTNINCPTKLIQDIKL
ncbi:MAG TPA: DNA topoisomerase I [Nitrososphaeraceae archaeon]|nr:DNA topoisomerase I [Nitrososphaeraceae archaeon]